MRGPGASGILGVLRREAPWFGYQARLQRNGRLFTRWFADAQHGGKRSARKAAAEWRERAARTLGPGRVCKGPRVRRYRFLRINETTGNRSPYVRWEAELTCGGMVYRRTFAASFYGEKGARHLAIEQAREWRRAWRAGERIEGGWPVGGRPVPRAGRGRTAQRRAAGRRA